MKAQKQLLANDRSIGSFVKKLQETILVNLFIFFFFSKPGKRFLNKKTFRKERKDIKSLGKVFKTKSVNRLPSFLYIFDVFILYFNFCGRGYK